MDGRKDDNGKLRYDLLPISAVEEIVKVLTFGAGKYADDNWQVVPGLESRYYAALQRHLTAWRKGEMIDADSGLPHLAHAGCCLLFILSKQVGFDRSLGEDVDAPIPYKLTELERLANAVDEDGPLDTTVLAQALPYQPVAEDAWEGGWEEHGEDRKVGQGP